MFVQLVADRGDVSRCQTGSKQWGNGGHVSERPLQGFQAKMGDDRLTSIQAYCEAIHEKDWAIPSSPLKM